MTTTNAQAPSLGATHPEDWTDKTVPPEGMESEEQARDDARYLQLLGALVDSTKLDQIPRLEPLIRDVLDLNSLNWIHGKPGSGKSFVALDMACHIATGLPWHENETRRGVVLYVLAEGAQGMHRRREAWEVHNGVAVPAGQLLFLPVAVDLLHSLDGRALARVAADLHAVMIVIDTQARVTVGGDENSAKDMGGFVAQLDHVRAGSGACVTVVHHEARSGDAPRGSSAIDGAASTIIRVTKDGAIVRLENTKQKESEEFDPIQGRLAQVDIPAGGRAACWSHGAMRPSDINRESEAKVLAAVSEFHETSAVSSTVLIETTGLARATVFRALNSLVTAGLIRNSGTPNRTSWVPCDTEPISGVS